MEPDEEIIIGLADCVVVFHSAGYCRHVEVGILQGKQTLIPAQTVHFDARGSVDVVPYDEGKFPAGKGCNVIVLGLVAKNEFVCNGHELAIPVQPGGKNHEIQFGMSLDGLHSLSEAIRCDIVIRVEEHQVLALCLVDANVAAGGCALGKSAPAYQSYA